ncbi:MULTISPECIES: aspartate kinase [Flagellimonas]|uniref:Aspartate kinase n=2 Tax=Flagellimonas TaxID=444459 RepID=A0A3A1NPV1_9FLAO|nr:MULTISPECIES: aspartate kinase [Allomuricauda]RIV46492.1 aspartate kinase [Allomuricauda maritima]RIV73174.1 aspartate kinase [Allomuricauda aequoris]TXJ99153.1 aspartate kinase [Allomuricauda maritima]TXK06982.1 aspartate kinase [Allomuricauda aequoris]
MKTISAVVEHYIKKKPFLQTALAQGIINLTSLSRQIKPEIADELGKDVKDGAIVMALKRLSDDLEFRATHKIVKVLKNIGEITVRSNLSDYTFLASDSILQQQAKLLEEVNENQDVFYTSSRGVNEINIVISNIMDSVVEKYFKHERCTQKAEGLSSITVKLPAENVSVPGIYYFIFQRLAWEGIILYEVISTTNEFTILVNDEQVDVAFKTIKDLKLL